MLAWWVSLRVDIVALLRELVVIAKSIDYSEKLRYFEGNNLGK